MTEAFEVRGLKTYYYSTEGIVKAVDGVSFQLEKGCALGLVGESGSGKTTIALSAMRLLPPGGKIVDGSILLDGADLANKTESEMNKIRWKKISYVFQGAMSSLNPLMRVGDQIAEAIMLHEKVGRSEALSKVHELLAMVGIEHSRASNYPHEFSGGMKQRAVIAMALSCSPHLVIADEPTSALDVMTTAQILNLVKELQRKTNLSIILITHDMSIVAEICDHVAVMYGGKLAEVTDAATFFSRPLHPYSLGLVRAFPSLTGPKHVLEPIAGDPPNLINPPSGCVFHPRCRWAEELCRAKVPELVEVRHGHYAACHSIDRVEKELKR